MNFLVNKILDDGSVSYGLTGSGYVVLIIVCVLLMTIGCFARDNNSKLNVKHIAFAAMAIALAVATSMIKVIKLPMGGSVTLFIHSAYRILVWNKDWSDSSYCIWSFAVIT